MVVEADDPVHHGQVVAIVGHEDHRRAVGSERFERPGSNGVAGGVVEPGERLVEEGDAGASGEDACKAHPRPFASGEGGGSPSREGLDPESLDRHRDAVLPLGTLEAKSGDRHFDVFTGRKVVVQRKMLFDQRDVTSAGGATVDGDAVDLDSTSKVAFEARDTPKKRRFAAPRRAGEAHDVAGGELEIDGADGPSAGERPDHPLEAKRGPLAVNRPTSHVPPVFA